MLILIKVITWMSSIFAHVSAWVWVLCMHVLYVQTNMFILCLCLCSHLCVCVSCTWICWHVFILSCNLDYICRMCEINFYFYVRLHVYAGIMWAYSICLCFVSVYIICIYASGQCYSKYMSSSLCACVVLYWHYWEDSLEIYTLRILENEEAPKWT